ncbi:50S ribosomal protein L29 [Desulfatitalea tepidiphila]|jgi:large subunit ribosomal protein L29|uniref:50S ribosomal protein L29 n=1 Tax=Desulfatitalea tepidiphila TaxID=1185843 RepID=UPI0006B40EEC|nr:50S ribosomal protein L29 [Desulfatitalea tepidiphila]
MKVEDIRTLSQDEMRQKLTDLRKELFNLRFQHGIGQLENPRKIKLIQKDIARIFTVLGEMARNPKQMDN